MTLPLKNVSLAEWFNSDKENADDRKHQKRATRSNLSQRLSGSLKVARTLGVVSQTLFNWVKAQREGKLKGVDSKPMSIELMEISRLRAELARVKMERDTLGHVVIHNCLQNTSLGKS